jgi:hypothetical protein
VTRYPITPGNGFWLEGKRWMLNRPGEWCYDRSTQSLYLWMPNGGSPAGADLTAATRLHGISGFNVRAVDLDGIEVRETRGDAIKIDGFDAKLAKLKLQNMAVFNAGRKGIFVINSARPGARKQAIGEIADTLVADSINEGIDLSGDRRWAVTRTQQIDVVRSTVRNAGIGYYARGAILMGHRAQALNNKVLGASYIGILGGKLNPIAGNEVRDFCLAFDDCGGIYVNGAYYSVRDEEPETELADADVGGRVTDNTIVGRYVSLDRQDGSSTSNGLNSGARHTTVAGIYLDDFAGRVRVDGNRIQGVDFGLLLNQGRDNTITGNQGSDSRRALFLQDNSAERTAMRGNTVTDNRFASFAGEPVVQLRSGRGDSSRLATFSRNRYEGGCADRMGFDDVEGAVTRFETFAQWRAAGRDRDEAAAFRPGGCAPEGVRGGAKMMTSGEFRSGVDGWYAYRASLSSMPGSHVLMVTPAGDADTFGGFRKFAVFPPEGFSIQDGKRYLLSFKAQADAPGEVAISFRKKDHHWSDQSAPVVVPVRNGFRSYSVLLTAAQTNPDAALVFAFYIDKHPATMGGKAYLSEVSVAQAVPLP